MRFTLCNHFISEFNTAYKLKKQSFIVEQSPLNFRFIEIMLKKGYLRSYRFLKTKFLVSIKYHKKRYLMVTLLRKSKKSHAIYHRAENVVPNAIYYTRHGLVYSSFMYKYKIGGLYVCKISFL